MFSQQCFDAPNKIIEKKKKTQHPHNMRAVVAIQIQDTPSLLGDFFFEGKKPPVIFRSMWHSNEYASL